MNKKTWGDPGKEPPGHSLSGLKPCTGNVLQTALIGSVDRNKELIDQIAPVSFHEVAFLI